MPVLKPLSYVGSVKHNYEYHYFSFTVKFSKSDIFVIKMACSLELAIIFKSNEPGARFTKHLKPKIFLSAIQFVWLLRKSKT